MSVFFAPDRLETPEFLIRSYFPGDGARIAEAIRTSYDSLKEFVSWASPDYSNDSAEWTARRGRGMYLLNRDYPMGIFSPDGERFLGGTGYRLFGAPLEEYSVEISMWLRGSAAGKGLATRVLLALLDWGFSDAWPWAKIMWVCDVRNAASIRVAQKGGLTLEGTMRRHPLPGRPDMHQFAILRDEYHRHAP
ncbi:MAG: GNAT family N-acetyltransferase [Anaerolineae bacterium]|nr:GNAT family N-acetyltransferase [Anaerolineae bacterium]